MTLKAELLLQTEVNNINSRGDTREAIMMQKRKTVKTLFGPPDQNELKRQCQQMEEDNKRKLRGFRNVELVGFIMNPPDQAKRQKRSSPVQSDFSSSEEEDMISKEPPTRQQGPTHNTSQKVDDLRNIESTSVPSQQSKLTSSTSSAAEDKKLSNMNGSPRIVAHRKGQQTITSEYTRYDDDTMRMRYKMESWKRKLKTYSETLLNWAEL